MIKIIKNEESHAILQKEDINDRWIDCSNESLLKFLNREGIIDRVQFEDYNGVADRLNVYFKKQPC